MSSPGLSLPPGEKPVLRLQDLAVGYGKGPRRRTILAGVTTDLVAGELACLVGPNGAGKSTLLRSIAGLQAVLGGRVLLAGVPLMRLTRRQVARQAATVLTDRVEPGQLRARDVVALGRHPHTDWTGRLSLDDQDVIDSALAQAGAADLAAALFGELSDGQRQRILIARALAQQPRVLLLDEPTAFLDPPARIGLMVLLAAIAANGAVAVLVCTHDLELAARTADTLWVAGHGTITCGGPEDLAHAGVLGGAFTSEGTVFDPAVLGFAPADDDRPAAAVDGEASLCVLAAHAMRRAGYRVTRTPGEADVRVKVERGPAHQVRSALISRGHSSTHVSLDALARHARGLRDLAAQTAITESGAEISEETTA